MQSIPTQLPIFPFDLGFLAFIACFAGVFLMIVGGFIYIVAYNIIRQNTIDHYTIVEILSSHQIIEQHHSLHHHGSSFGMMGSMHHSSVWSIQYQRFTARTDNNKTIVFNCKRTTNVSSRDVELMMIELNKVVPGGFYANITLVGGGAETAEHIFPDLTQITVRPVVSQ